MVDMSVKGPPDETEYYLHEDRLEQSEYHDIARSLTRQVLDASPRRVSEIRLMGTISVLKRAGADEDALNTLHDAGFTITDKQLDGRVTASEEVTNAVLSLYLPALHHAHFFDSNGYGIAARYDDHFQHYWLPASVYPTLKQQLCPAALKALEEVHYRKQTDDDN